MGNTDAAERAELARSNLRKKRPDLEQALAGSMGPHQRFLLEARSS